MLVGDKCAIELYENAFLSLFIIVYALILLNKGGGWEHAFEWNKTPVLCSEWMTAKLPFVSSAVCFYVFLRAAGYAPAEPESVPETCDVRRGKSEQWWAGFC